MKKNKVYTKQRAILQFNLKWDKINKRESLLGFLPNPPKKDGSRSALAIAPRPESLLYPYMSPGEFWEVEFYVSDDSKIAKAEPIARAPLAYQIVTTDKYNKKLDRTKRMVGVHIFVPNTPKGVDNVLLKKVFPDSRRFSDEVMGGLIHKICEKRGLDVYKNDLVELYKDALSEVALTEKTEALTIAEAVDLAKSITDTETENTMWLNERALFNRMKTYYNPHKGECVDALDLVERISEELHIIKYDEDRKEFKVAR